MSATNSATNHEATARARKALAIYRLITSPRLRGTMTPAELLAAVTAWTEEQWASASIVTGTKPASTETRALVLSMLKDDTDDAADVFARFGGAA